MLLVLPTLAICLVASGSMLRVEAAKSLVRITTIPGQGPFRLGQTVQFSCELDQAQSYPVTYLWRNVEYVGGSSIYSTEHFNRTYYPDHLRYCWYFCSIILNGVVLGSADKLVEVYGLLQTDEPITRAFSLHERMVMRINISDFNSRAQYIRSLAWYHNGTKLTSDDRVTITNNGTSLNLSNMTESDAGKYEVKINSLGSDPAICDDLLPMLENFVLHASVTFLLQESNPPTYNPEDLILDYALPAYQGSVHQSFAIDNTFMINAAAVLDITGDIYDALYKDGVRVINRSTYNIIVLYDKVIKQSLRIPYNNTDDIAGHYQHTASANFEAINNATCPDYYVYIADTFYFIIPIFTLYWNIRSHDSTACPTIAPSTYPTIAPTTCPPTTCPTIVPTAAPTLAPTTAPHQDKVRLIISGVSSFLVGVLCGALAGLGMLVVYIRWKKSRSNSPPPSSLKPLASPSSLPLQAPPMLHEGKIDNVSDTAIYENMDTIANTYTPKEQLQQYLAYTNVM